MGKLTLPMKFQLDSSNLGQSDGILVINFFFDNFESFEIDLMKGALKMKNETITIIKLIDLKVEAAALPKNETNSNSYDNFLGDHTSPESKQNFPTRNSTSFKHSTKENRSFTSGCKGKDQYIYDVPCDDLINNEVSPIRSLIKI
jgi:hypothetical protein